MSSPLAVFRKYQKILLAIFGVALMLVFTIGSFVNSSISRQNRTSQKDSVAATYDGGKITEAELQAWRRDHNVLTNFTRNVALLADSRKAQIDPYLLAFLGGDSDEALLQTKLFSQEAKNLGIGITDDEVMQFVDQLTQGMVERGEYETLLAQITSGRMSPRQFLEAMRNQLLSLRYQELILQGLTDVTPSAYWDCFQRLNRRIAASAVPYPVSEFMGKSDAPSESAIATLYDEAKHRSPSPDSPEPGFKLSKKVAIEFIKADLQPFVEEEKTNVTEADILAYYESHKDQFKNVALPTEQDVEGTKPADLTPKTESDATDPATSSDAAPSSATDSSSSEATTPEGTQSIEEPATEAPSDSPSSSDSGAKSNCGPQEPSATESATDSSDSTSETSDAVPDTAVEPSAEISSDAAADQSTPVAEADSKNVVDDATTGDPPTDSADSASATKDTAGPTTGSAEKTLDNLPEDIIERQTDFKPLAEVSDEIKTLLARQKANTRLEGLMNEVQGQMNNYFGSFVSWEASPDRDQLEQPQPPSLEQLASVRGFTTGRIPLVNDLELVYVDPVTKQHKYEIGSAYEIDASQGIARVTMSDIAFGDELKKYEVRRISGSRLDNYFIFWKTDEQEARVPEMEECRDKVVRAIKSKQAVKRATDQAHADALQIRRSGKSLADHFRGVSNKRVIDTGSFTWMTLGFMTQGSIRFSEVPGIPYAGNSFMQSVFSLQKGEIGVAVDEPQSTVYLIEVNSEETNPEGLRSAFVKTGLTPDVGQVYNSVANFRLRDWYQDYLKRREVKWQRTPGDGRSMRE